MKLQNLTVIFVIVIIPVILLVSLYITNGLKTIKYQAIYDSGLLTATHDAIYAFELNTTNDAYSDNAETKRNILKSSVKAFERSLCNTCGISSYNTKEIEEINHQIEIENIWNGIPIFGTLRSKRCYFTFW